MEILEKDKRRMFELLNKTVNDNSDQLTITKEEFLELAKYMRSYLLKDLVDDISPETALLFSSEFVISKEMSVNHWMSYQMYLDKILISDAFLDNIINKQAGFCRFINGLSHELGHCLQYFASNLNEFKEMADEEGLTIINEMYDRIGYSQFSEFLKILDTDSESRKIDILEFGYAKLTDPKLSFSLYENLSFEKSARAVGVRLTKQFLMDIKNEEMCSQNVKNNVSNWAKELKHIIMVDDLDDNLRRGLDRRIKESQEEEAWLEENRNNISESEYVERYTKLGRKKYMIDIAERRFDVNINELFDRIRKGYTLNEILELYERYKKNAIENGEKVDLTPYNIRTLYFYGMSVKDGIMYYNKNKHKEECVGGSTIKWKNYLKRSIVERMPKEDLLKLKNLTNIDTM